MGADLSSTVEPDLSGVVLAPWDRNALIYLGIIWGLVFYVIAMLWTAFALIDRWKGPRGKIRTTFGSVIGALALSTAWPVVVAYMIAKT